MELETPAIGFDLDGVLIQNPFELGVEPHIRALIAGSAGNGGRYAETAGGGATREGGGARDALIARQIFELFHKRLAEDPVRAYDWDSVFAEVASGWGSVELPRVEELVLHYTAREGYVAALEGAHTALRLVREAGYRAVAITNGFAPFQRPVLERLGMLGEFAALITPDRAGATKPSRQIFDAAAHLEAHVGDTLVHDVLGANRIGISSLWVHPLAPRRPTRDPALIEAAVHRALTSDPHRGTLGEVRTGELIPDYAGRNVAELVAFYLASRKAPTLAGQRAGTAAARETATT